MTASAWPGGDGEAGDGELDRGRQPKMDAYRCFLVAGWARIMLAYISPGGYFSPR